MKYTLVCSCTIQQAFKSQLIRLIYDRTVMENEEFLQNMDVFVNNWCPIMKNCPCKENIEKNIDDQEGVICLPQRNQN